MLADAQQLGLGRGVEVVRHARLLRVERDLGFGEVRRRVVGLDPLLRLARVVLLRAREELVLKVRDVRVERAHAHGLEQLDAVLDEAAVDERLVALRVDQRDHRVDDVLLDLRVDERLEVLEARDVQRRQRVVLDVVAVQIHEEEAHPLVHDLVVRPPRRQLREQEVLALLAQRGQDRLRQIVADGLAVALVELLGPVVRRPLRAHVVARRVRLDVLLGREEVLRLLVQAAVEHLLEHVDGLGLDLVVPPFLKRDDLRRQHFVAAMVRGGHRGARRTVAVRAVERSRKQRTPCRRPWRQQSSGVALRRLWAGVLAAD
mmetsp:Transcript_29408/g.88474  ORF Transcript_29408/g.88474 Transcript_29408/m.88474 type:complete len:317 (-) Transcript_29408:35-985(-)